MSCLVKCQDVKAGDGTGNGDGKECISSRTGRTLENRTFFQNFINTSQGYCKLETCLVTHWQTGESTSGGMCGGDVRAYV